MPHSQPTTSLITAPTNAYPSAHLNQTTTALILSVLSTAPTEHLQTLPQALEYALPFAQVDSIAILYQEGVRLYARWAIGDKEEV